MSTTTCRIGFGPLRSPGAFAFTLAAALTLVCGVDAHATVKTKVSLLNGSQEVEPNASGAIGCARYEIDTIKNTLRYHIVFCGLEGDLTGAHFHGPAGIGEGAGVVHPLQAGNPMVGVWEYPEGMEQAILGGRIYVNVHSSMWPGGEIRGQVVDMVAQINSFQENPPFGGSGTGYGLFNIDTFSNELDYHITVLSLEGTEAAAHIHGFALHTDNAGVIHPLPSGSPKVGTFAYDQSMEDAILNGQTYVNVHSDESPSGEIRGQIVSTVAPLDAEQEVPPLDEEGCGCGFVAFEKNGTALSYYLEYDELTGPAAAAHIHGFAPPGGTAGVKHGIGTDNPAKGMWDYPPEDAENVENGLTYFNVHTAAHGGGELRGQIIVPSKPCPTDIDCNGDTGFGDLLALLAAWGPYEPCPPYSAADLNRDCEVGFGDLLELLANWGDCP